MLSDRENEVFLKCTSTLVKEIRELPEKSRQEYATKLIADLEELLKEEQDAAVRKLQAEAKPI